MMSAKLATLALREIKVFPIKSYDDIVSVHDVDDNKKILLCNSNYTAEVVM